MPPTHFILHEASIRPLAQRSTTMSGHGRGSGGRPACVLPVRHCAAGRHATPTAPLAHLSRWGCGRPQVKNTLERKTWFSIFLCNTPDVASDLFGACRQMTRKPNVNRDQHLATLADNLSAIDSRRNTNPIAANR